MLKAVISNKKFCNCLFLVSLSLIVVMYMWKETMFFINYYPIVSNILRFIGYTLLGLKLLLSLLNKKYSLKFIICSSIILSYLMFVSYMSKTVAYFFLFLYIIASIDVNFDDIIRTMFYMHIVFIIFIVLICIIGLIPDNVFYHYPRIRHSLGFGYTTALANFWFYVTLMYIYINNDYINKKNAFIKIIGLCCIIFVNIYIYYMSRTRSAFILSILAIILYLVLIYIKCLRKYNFFYKIIAILSPIILSGFVLIISYIYEPNCKFLEWINVVTNGRILLGHDILLQEGLSLFARNIGFVRIGINGENLYGFVDSSFVRYLINFGIIFFVLLIMGIEYYAYLINKKKDTIMLLIFVIILMHVTFDPQLLYIQYNPFLYILSYKNTVQLRNID